MNRHCVVIPIYNHHHKLAGLLSDLKPYGLPVLLIDDGSDADSAAKIGRIIKDYSQVQLTTLPTNSGKGGAVKTGVRMAQQSGYSHAIQIDADYQHNVADIPKFIALSDQHPDAVVCGVPEYDETVNKGRFYARYLTHVWVWINTLSFDIKDSMCGFRSYPVAETIMLIDSVKIGDRMSFDTEVLVRLHWQSVPVINLHTRVVYHNDVPSNFRLVADNAGISWMHTRLFFGMLIRLPRLMFKKIKGE